MEYKKQSLTYIGWADAYACLIEHFPQTTYIFDEPPNLPLSAIINIVYKEIF